MNNNRLSFLPALIWWLFTFYLLVLPGNDLPEISWSNRIYLDKWIHIVLFAVLVILWSIPFLKKPLVSTSVYIIILMAAWLYGIVMEFVQKYFVPLRSFDVIDMLGDGVGCVLGYLFIKYVLRKKVKSQTKSV